MIGVEDHVITMNKADELVYATNFELLQGLTQTYGISRTANSAYIGGTMFWVRASIYEDFFSENSPLGIRATLETGNVMDHAGGTHTHSWERLLGWIVGSKGYKVMGI
jgi:lipopolysaccharide biosynthesis protein